MSSVRMCDFETPEGPCGTIFSEREPGWSTGQMTVIGDDGETHTERADFCPDHTGTPSQRRGKMPRFRATQPGLPAPAGSAAPSAPSSEDVNDWSRGATGTSA